MTRQRLLKRDEVKSVLSADNVLSSDIISKDPAPNGSGSVLENVCEDHPVESQEEVLQSELPPTESVLSQPPASPNAQAPPKVAGAWGSKPAGAWADLFKNTESASKSVIIYADGQQVSSAEEAKRNQVG